MKIPPTRNHRQLVAWINAASLFDAAGRAVCATAVRVNTSTDSKVAGTRFRRVGKGRWGLRLEIRSSIGTLYQHTSSETYRRHEEARRWVECNLHQARSN